MAKWALVAVAGFLSLGVSLSAQEALSSGTFSPSRFSLANPGSGNGVEPRATVGQGASFAALNSVYYGPTPLALDDGRIFSFPSAFGWVQATPVDFLPLLVADYPGPFTTGVPLSPEFDVRPAGPFSRFNHASGEVGFFFGTTTGKFGRQEFGTHFEGEIDNGNTQITVGASYWHATGHLSH